jgi:metal-responsive CopG/Arc/MetJ family transcriptional regulator
MLRVYAGRVTFVHMNKTRVSMLQPASLMKWVDEQAKTQERTRTDIVRIALEMYQKVRRD